MCRKTCLDGINHGLVKGDRAVGLRFPLLELEAVARPQVTHVTDADRQQFVGSEGCVDAEGKETKVARIAFAQFLDPLDVSHIADRLDLDRSAPDRVVLIVGLCHCPRFGC